MFFVRQKSDERATREKAWATTLALATGSALAGSVLVGAPAGAAPIDSIGGAGAAASKDLVVIGIPGKNLPGKGDAGGAEIWRKDGRHQLLAAPSPKAGDRFGTSVLAYDVTGDRHSEILVGAPGCDVSGKADSGAVFVYKDSSTGYKFWKAITLGSGRIQAGSLFGTSVDGYSYHDSEDSLAVGAPGYDVGTVKDAGIVLDLDARLAVQEVLTAKSYDIKPGAGDRFGTDLEVGFLYRVIGAPGRTVSGKAKAGAVFYQAELAIGMVTQDSPDVPGTAAAGNGYGSSIADTGENYVVGIPGLDVNGKKDAGGIHLLDISEGGGAPGDGGATASPVYTQDSKGAPGAAEAGDKMGSSVGGTPRRPFLGLCGRPQ